MNKFIVIFIAIFSISSCKSNFNPIKLALKSEKPSIKKITKKISKYDVQIKLTVIDSNKNFNDYKDQLVKETYQEKDEDPTGRKISNYGGWQSNQTHIIDCKSETRGMRSVSKACSCPSVSRLAAMKSL